MGGPPSVFCQTAATGTAQPLQASSLRGLQDNAELREVLVAALVLEVYIRDFFHETAVKTLTLIRGTKGNDAQA